MSHHIASAIIFNGILTQIDLEGEDLSGYGILKKVPNWFVTLHPREKFPKPKPAVPNPEENQQIVDAWELDPIYDLPEHLREYQWEVDNYMEEKRTWNEMQDLKLLRKWVFWCADFADYEQDFTLKYRYQQ
jgi:hypothetical protein